MVDTSSIIKSLGAGSGLNMTQLANDLAVAEFQQRSERLAAKSETLAQQISTAATIKNGMSTLANSLGDRLRTGDLAAKPKVANSAVASASIPVGTSGKGSYSLEVSQLAGNQSLAGPAVASADDPFGAGTLTIRLGTVSGGSFTADPDQAQIDITIASGSSLRDVAAAINGSGSGVTAYISQTVDGPRLVMKGAEGAKNGFVVEATETAGEEGLAALAWEPTTGDPARQLGTAQDALFKLDGLAMSSATNQTEQVAPGLKLNLTGTNVGAPTTITFGNPADQIQSAMQDFVGALNEVVSELQRATDPLTGELRSDSGARNLRTRLGRLAGEAVMPNAVGGAPKTLADLGLVLQRDGSFKLDAKQLTATLERDPEGVAAMFTTGLYGVYATFDKLSRDANSTGDPGSLAGSISRYERLAEEVKDRTAEIAEKQEDFRARMVSRFAAADARIAASQSTLSFLQSQIDAWNGSRN